ncbi:SagB family peptide dehydrogenase [Catenulispora subtropica]|uniref:Nitroreductase domain-containing protein n=1 Tax=Catenulispora subtropica TaxID=450798 RepID=A0ABN2TGY7_9ACTN
MAADAPSPTAPQTGGAVRQLWSLRADVLVETADRALTLVSRWGETVVRSPGPLLRDSLLRMQLGPIWLDNVLDVERRPQAQVVAERAAMMLALGRLEHLVVRSLAAEGGGRILMSAEPVARAARFRPRPVADGVPVRLSRFATLRTVGGLLTAESPLALHRVLLHQPEAAMLVAALAGPRTPEALEELVGGPPELVRTAVSYLLAAGIAVPGREGVPNPVFDEDDDPVLRMWPPGDLAFHSASTLGRHDGDFGATYPLGAGPNPEPAVKKRARTGRIPLYRPELKEVQAADAPFTAVLEGRRSHRRFDPDPPTVEELGELLFRALRIRAQNAIGGEAEAGYLLDRPYPAGGAVHELEFYVTVARCRGLRPGVYAYDALRHELVPVPSQPQDRCDQLAQAQLAAELENPPPLLITVTARFGRVFWKYSGIGYRLVLQDTGVVLQTLYLVATAMGLGVCALGAVDIDRTSRVLDLDWRVESGVGAMVLGRPRGVVRPAPGPPEGETWGNCAPIAATGVV